MNQEQGATSQEQKSIPADSVQNQKVQEIIDILKTLHSDFVPPQKLTFRTDVRKIQNKIQIRASYFQLEDVKNECATKWENVQLDLEHDVPFQALVTFVSSKSDNAQVIPLNVLDQLHDYMIIMKKYYSMTRSLLSGIVTKENCKVGDLIILEINDLFYRVKVLQKTPQFNFFLIDFGFHLVLDYDNTYLDNLYPPCRRETLQPALKGFKMVQSGDIAPFSVLWIEFVKDPPILTKDLLMRQVMTPGTEKELLIMNSSNLEDGFMSFIEFNSKTHAFYDRLKVGAEKAYEENLKKNTIGYTPQVNELIWSPFFDLPYYLRGVCLSVDGHYATVYIVDYDLLVAMTPTSKIIKMNHPIMFTHCIQTTILFNFEELTANKSMEEIQIMKEKLLGMVIVTDKIELDETGINYMLHIHPERFEVLLG